MNKPKEVSLVEHSEKPPILNSKFTKYRNLNCIYTNIRSIMNKNKRDEIELLLAENKIDIIGIAESWTTEDIADAEISFKGFSLFRKDRRNDKTRGGGVLLYLKDDLKPKLETNGDEGEIIWGSFKISKQEDLYVGVCYRSPNATAEEENKILNSIRSKCDKAILVMGDFNFRNINWETGEGGGDSAKFLDVVNDLFLTQHVRKPTRGENILDLVFTSEAGLVKDLEVGCPVGNSDHNLLSWVINCEEVRSISTRTVCLDYNNGNYKDAVHELLETEWERTFENLSVNESWTRFREIIKGIEVKYIPVKTLKPRIFPKWMTGKIKRNIKKRNRLWNRYNTAPSYSRRAEYNKIRNEVNADIRRAKQDFEVRLSRNIVDNTKSFYSYVNSKRIHKDNLGPLRNERGELTSDDKEMGSVLNKFFAGVFTKENLTTLPQANVKVMEGKEVTVGNLDITSDSIGKAIDTLKKNKTGGIDGMNTTVLKGLKDGIIKPLTIIYRKSLEDSEIPTDWRLANVTPIFKKGSKADAGNYRPISLTCYGSKIMERIIKEKLTQYIEENKIIYDSQHGFRNNRSCLTNLLEFMEYVTGYVDQGEPMDIIFLDLKKAFDKVPHSRLMIKISALGINGKIYDWIKAWLRDRKQRVVVNGEESEWVDVSSGVPQGSVLGPLLFLIYINDVDEYIRSKIFKFADDAKIVGGVRTLEGVNVIKNDLIALSRWCSEWQMELNVEKCKVMHVGVNNKMERYGINGQDLVETSEEKDLGVIINQNLKVSQQCLTAAKKGNQILGLIYRTFSMRSKEIIVRLYKALVRPHLDYCIQAWRPHLQKDIDVLEKVQRRATRMIEGLKDLYYEERLKVVRLTTLENRMIRADMLEVFKIVKGLEGLKENNFFVRRGEGRLRGHQYTLIKKSFRTNLGKFSFGNRVINIWNSLPANVVSSGTINEFKSGLDRFLGSIGGFK